MLSRVLMRIGGGNLTKYFSKFFSTAKIGGVTGDIKFNLENHEWFFQYEIQGKKCIKVGVTGEAVRKMDGVTHIEWQQEREFSQDQALVELESCKGTFPINAPFDCKLLRNNQEILSPDNDFSALKTSPQDEGWILEIESSNDIKQIEDLIDESEYNKQTAVEQDD